MKFSGWLSASWLNGFLAHVRADSDSEVSTYDLKLSIAVSNASTIEHSAQIEANDVVSRQHSTKRTRSHKEHTHPQIRRLRNLREIRLFIVLFELHACNNFFICCFGSGIVDVAIGVEKSDNVFGFLGPALDCEPARRFWDEL
jgi:hypothetical protein